MLEVKSYSNYILNDISLQLNDDQNLIILGSNGCGKTTLAKVISGIISNKSVTIDGEYVSELYGEKRTELINYLPPKLNVFDDHISVLEFLELNNLYSLKDINEVLEILNISHLAEKSCKFLSSGESQLLLIAGAILHNAKYTIFDESTSNLDPSKLKMIFKLLISNEYFNSKIVITHNLHFAYKLGFDILFMKDGRVEFYGSNEEFFDNRYINDFFEGSVKKVDGNIVVDI